MALPVLVRHDPGCKFARGKGVDLDDEGNIIAGEIQAGHSDAAKRIADTYNLHKSAGAPVGHWIAVALADGTSDGCAYPGKAEAVRHQHHSEWWFAYIPLCPGSMSVCEAESVLYMRRMEARLHLADRDDPRGGMDVIPRLTTEDTRRQLAALAGHGSLPVALGYRKE